LQQNVQEQEKEKNHRNSEQGKEQRQRLLTSLHLQRRILKLLQQQQEQE
jgi:hypothetical protein